MSGPQRFAPEGDRRTGVCSTEDWEREGEQLPGPQEFWQHQEQGSQHRAAGDKVLLGCCLGSAWLWAPVGIEVEVARLLDPGNTGVAGGYCPRRYGAATVFPSL